MDERFSINLAAIQNDLARIEGILPSAVVNSVLGKATPTLEHDAVLRYNGALLWYHRNGWLWHWVMKAFMPVRLMKRSMFGKGSGITIRAIVYAVLLSLGWTICLQERYYRENLFSTIWVLVVLGFVGPYLLALLALVKNKALYAGAKATFTGVQYYGE